MRGADGLEHHRPDLDENCELIAAVMFLDLDFFKEINDTLGHAAGDELLRQVAVRLQVLVRPQDTFARLGGDEFAMLLDGLHHTDDAVVVASRAINLLTKPFVLDGHQALVSTSIGIAFCSPTNNVRDPGMLLRHADTALYQAKAAGRGTYRLLQIDKGLIGTASTMTASSIERIATLATAPAKDSIRAMRDTG